MPSEWGSKRYSRFCVGWNLQRSQVVVTLPVPIESIEHHHVLIDSEVEPDKFFGGSDCVSCHRRLCW
jgi:hypothetical protein